MTAHTNFDPSFPGFINVSRQGDGSVRIVARGDPTQHEGVYVCGFARDKGAEGRCTPGDDRCNNYCNMAPQLGPMADRPKDATHARCAETITLTIPAEAWAQLTPDDGDPSRAVAAELLAERHRQVGEEGYAAAHDDQYTDGQLENAALTYLQYGRAEDRRETGRLFASQGEAPPSWPWDPRFWKPDNCRRMLVRAGALVIAAIERLDRERCPKCGGGHKSRYEGACDGPPIPSGPPPHGMMG